MSDYLGFFFATCVNLRGNLRVRLATQRKSLGLKSPDLFSFKRSYLKFLNVRVSPFADYCQKRMYLSGLAKICRTPPAQI